MIKRNQVYNMDCMDAMKLMPDNYAGLCIVDPPYGIGIDGQKEQLNNKNPKHNRKGHASKGWDKRPKAAYFNQLFRVSRHQIIWGANYFVEHLDRPSKGWIFWYKGQEGLTMSDGELAYSSFDKPTRIVIMNRVKLLIEGTIHPTQKPVDLYKWLLQNYAKEGDLILDTHVGSGSSIIACIDMGFDYIGYEIDTDYYKAMQERIYQFTRQTKLL